MRLVQELPCLSVCLSVCPCIWVLCGQYFLSLRTFWNQTEHSGASSWAGVSCRHMECYLPCQDYNHNNFYSTLPHEQIMSSWWCTISQSKPQKETAIRIDTMNKCYVYMQQVVKKERRIHSAIFHALSAFLKGSLIGRYCQTESEGANPQWLSHMFWISETCNFWPLGEGHPAIWLIHTPSPTKSRFWENQPPHPPPPPFF